MLKFRLPVVLTAICGLAVVALPGGMAAAASPTKAGARCGSDCLTGMMNQYLAKMTAHDVKGVPIRSDAVLRENSHPVKLGEGFWTRGGEVKAKQIFADPVTGQVWTYAAFQLKDGPLAQISVRLKVEQRRITEVETLINTGNTPDSPYRGGPYNAENILEQEILYTAPIPKGRGSTREELIKIADGYFEAIATHNPDAAKFGSRCERYESGSRGTNQLRRNADQAASGAQGNWSGTCGSSLVSLTGQQTIERRYPVVDVERGVVVGYMFIQHHERAMPQDNFINEMFKIIDGKIRQADAVGFQLPAPATSGFH